jgi:hypothetical protein
MRAQSGFMPIHRFNFFDYDGNFKHAAAELDTDAMILTITGHSFSYTNLTVRRNGLGPFRPANRDQFLLDLAEATDGQCRMHTSGRIIIQLFDHPPYYYMEPCLAE